MALFEFAPRDNGPDGSRIQHSCNCRCKIHEYTKKPLVLVDHINIMDIRLSRPCIEDPTRYIAECHLGEKVRMEKLCDILRSMGAKDLKCSIKLGVARFELEGRSVMIYQSGRVDIRRIKTADEARKVMGQIMRMIQGALNGTSS